MTIREMRNKGYDGRDIITLYFHSPVSNSASMELFEIHAPWWGFRNADDFAQAFEALGYKITRIHGCIDLSTGIVTDRTTNETHIDGWHLLNTCPEHLRKQINHVHTGFWSKKGEIYAKHGYYWSEAAIKEWNEYEQKENSSPRPQADC